MKTALAVQFTVCGLLAQNQVQIVMPGTALHDDYLFNQSWQYDQRDYTGLPHDFYFANVSAASPLGTRRSAPYCAIQPNPGTQYIPPVILNWWQYPPDLRRVHGNRRFAGVARVPMARARMSSVDGAEVYASTGEYLQSAEFSYPDAIATGFKFLGEFIGQHRNTSSTDGYYTQAVYFSDRECFDGGTEYGWYHQPVSYGGGTSYDQAANQVNFYYSEFSNCGFQYVCSPDSNYDHTVWQSTRIYSLNFNEPNRNGTYEWNYQVLRCPGGGCPGVSNSNDAFALSITDPASGAAAQCSVSGPTAIYFPIAGACWNVTLAISLPAPYGYPPASVTNSGYITFADQSSTIFPRSLGYVCCGPPPARNVIPTVYPDGHSARNAELYVGSAYVLFE